MKSQLRTAALVSLLIAANLAVDVATMWFNAEVRQHAAQPPTASSSGDSAATYCHPTRIKGARSNLAGTKPGPGAPQVDSPSPLLREHVCSRLSRQRRLRRASRVLLKHASIAKSSASAPLRLRVRPSPISRNRLPAHQRSFAPRNPLPGRITSRDEAPRQLHIIHNSAASHRNQ